MAAEYFCKGHAVAQLLENNRFMSNLFERQRNRLLDYFQWNDNYAVMISHHEIA